jgi:hypothetical protein
MRVWSASALALLACMVAGARLAGAEERTTENISGLWKASHAPAKIAVVAREGDAHPHVLHAVCLDKKRARVTFDADPALFAEAVGKSRHLVMRVGEDRSRRDYFVEQIILNEFGPYGWAPQIDVDVSLFERWMAAAPVEFSWGWKEQNTFRELGRYRLPDQNRQSAIRSFIDACF